MNDNIKKAEGGCYCGAIRYEATGDEDYVAFCHCEDCRNSTGAPAVVYVVYEEKQVQFVKGKRKVFESEPGIHRTFCSDCGTPIAYEAEWDGQSTIGFFIGTLDNPNDFKPEKHVFDLDRVSWYDVSDHLPRYYRVPGDGDPSRYGPIGETESS